MSNRLCPQQMVIALDFGSAFSGYAYAFNDGSEKITKKEKWDNSASSYVKTRTDLLYSPNAIKRCGSIGENECKNDIGGEFFWGWTAFAMKNEKKDYIFFSDRFKMALYNPKKIDEKTKEPLIQGSDNKFYPVKSLVTDMLRALKYTALSEIKNLLHITPVSIRWVVTVPAIWPDAQKNIMYEAAERAGLKRNSDDEIMIVLEPEGAAVYTKKQATTFGLEADNNYTYMIVDCGGGTVDITVQRLTNNKLEILSTPDGGALGATYVDDVFFNLISEIFEDPSTGDNTYAKYYDAEFAGNRKPNDNFFNEKYKWENLKCQSSTQNETVGRKVDFPLSFGFIKYLEKNYAELIADLENKGLLDEAQLWFSKDELKKKVFDRITDPICEKIQHQLDILDEDCDIVLVGGFSESTFLQKKVDARFSKKCKVFKLPYPGEAVLFGAIHIGLNPEIIPIRRSALTYGVDCNLVFEDGIDDPNKKYYSKYRKTHYCRDRFYILVQKGEKIRMDDKPILCGTFYPSEPDQTIVNFTLYSSEKNDVRYCDEPSANRLGEITVKIPDTSKGVERAIELYIYFKDTELKVEAKDTESKEKYVAEIYFPPHYGHVNNS